MRLSAATVGMLLGLALLLSACGEDGTTAVGEPSSTTGPARSQAAAPPSAACRSQLHDFLAAMAILRDNLARGLSYDDYLAEVKHTRAAYARIHPRQLQAGCLLASGGPAERAFNLYIDAANAWGDCLATVTCSTRSVEPALQRKWALAARQLATAQAGLKS